MFFGNWSYSKPSVLPTSSKSASFPLSWMGDFLKRSRRYLQLYVYYLHSAFLPKQSSYWTSFWQMCHSSSPTVTCFPTNINNHFWCRCELQINAISFILVALKTSYLVHQTENRCFISRTTLFLKQFYSWRFSRCKNRHIIGTSPKLIFHGRQTVYKQLFANDSNITHVFESAKTFAPKFHKYHF